MAKSATIIGLGISGCVAALSLTRLSITCTIYELRPTPSTIGGAVNLTPNALRLLGGLGVELNGCIVDAIEIFSYHTGSKLGELSFKGNVSHSLRIERSVLLAALLDAVKRAGIRVVHAAKLVGIREHDDETITALFENGSDARTGFLLGCDGMYSAVRMSFVEPERKPIYTGACTAYTIIEKTGIKSDIHFHQTALNSGRYGSLLSSYTDQEKSRVYLGVVMETEEQDSREGWKARGTDHERTIKEIRRRYDNSAFPCLAEMIGKAEEWIFYPVCRLNPGGTWTKGRVLLLGDAAHGMPPQGESTGLAIEDSILLGRVLKDFPDMPIDAAFEVYSKTRKPRIDIAYAEAVSRWEGVKDKTWFRQKCEEWLTWLYLWIKSDAFEKSVMYDVTKEEIIP